MLSLNSVGCFKFESCAMSAIVNTAYPGPGITLGELPTVLVTRAYVICLYLLATRFVSHLCLVHSLLDLPQPSGRDATKARYMR